ncbi:hypothetical protein [Brevibacillus sp. BC25]|uniref:hypothetical protein n=1 Tax=Brevibacillus sp. BC25 TaxID=1144308 RepID=UPI0002710AD2|nr:hypothetical protein [Brevibacillus sp. BC25]EJL31413.1 hypothetical protein PMI05_00776 [Brevibacillus sp. BC25]
MTLKKSFFTILSALLLSTAVIPSTYASAQIAKSQDVVIQHAQDNKQNQVKQLTSEEQGNAKHEIKEEAAVVPVIGIIIRAGVVAWKGYKTYERVSEAYVENAIEDHYGLKSSRSSTTLMEYQVGSEVFELKFGTSKWGLEHILGKHHPKYYYGIDFGKKNSMFEPNIGIEDIENMITILSFQSNNDDKIEKALKNGKRATVYGSWLGEEYTLVIEDGKVITLYPDGWNMVEYD